MIEPFGAADAEAVARLHAASWQRTYAEDLPVDYLARQAPAERLALWRARTSPPAAKDALALKATRDGGLLGFAYAVREADGVLLDNLHVRPDCKGQGVGGRLFDAVRRWAFAQPVSGPLYLWVVQSNAEAIAFYVGRGGVLADEAMGEIIPGWRVPSRRVVFLRQPGRAY